MDAIVNKIAQSGLITVDLETFFPDPDTIASFDIRPYLFREMILREKDFRAAIQELDTEPFRDKKVAVFCGVDVIIPKWAYMLIASRLLPVAEKIYFGDPAKVAEDILLENVAQLDGTVYSGKRVVIKGCGDRDLPDAAYLAITLKLQPEVKSLMYGEACSTVPVYKQKG